MSKGIIISTSMPDAIANVSGRIAAMFSTTTLMAAETRIRDGMICIVGTTTASVYWYDSDAVSGDVLSAAGGYWKLIAYDVASLAAVGGAALIGTSRSSTVEVELSALRTDALSAADEVYVPLGSLRLSTGAAIAAFANGTTDGFELSGSECLGIRWNDSGSSRITVAGEFHVPACWNNAAGITAHFRGFRVGAADTTMVLTVTAFAQAVGDAYTADSDAGGSSTAFNGSTTIITDETLAFSAGVLPAGAKVSFTAVPDAALDADDFVLTGIRLVGTRSMRTG